VRFRDLVRSGQNKRLRGMVGRKISGSTGCLEKPDVGNRAGFG
jgi:hypothetical protein